MNNLKKVGTIVNQEQNQDRYTPINQLTQYDKTFCIKGGVIRKSDKRIFKKKNGEGSVFHMVIGDGTKAIQIIFFNDLATKYFDLVQEGKMISVTDGSIKVANKYNQTDNRIEIVAHGKTEVRLLNEKMDQSKRYYNFIKIG